MYFYRKIVINFSTFIKNPRIMYTFTVLLVLEIESSF